MSENNRIGLTDLPATEDQFEIGNYIKGLGNFILKCETPMTISIQGTWGSGKTSIMNMVQKEIQKDVISVFFNTWQFSQFSLGNALPISMINFFISQLAGDTPEKRNAFLESLPKGGAYLASFLINNILRISTGGWVTNAITKEHVDKGLKILGRKDKNKVEEEKIATSEDETFLLAQSILALKTTLQESVNKACSDQKKDRVVVFIDDLDRLIPSKAMELLEVLKIFFDCNNCVFVLAIDYDVVIRGAAEKYGFKLNSRTPQGLKEAEKGRAFFDKIIQVPFKVPVVDYNIKSYLEEGLRKIDINPNPKDMEKYQSLCSLSLGTNPRGLKRLLNAFLLLNTVRAIKNKDNDKQLLILFGLLCLQQYRENIYNLIVRVNKGISDNAEEALKVFARLYSNDEESLNTLNQNYRTEILYEDVSSFTPFLEEFLGTIDIDPQQLDFLRDEDALLTQEQQNLLSKYNDNYMQLNELLKLSATTATEDIKTPSKAFSIDNMTDKQRDRYNFWCELKPFALNNPEFMNSGMRFPEFKDESWLGFASGSGKVYLSIRQARRNKKCFVTYFCKKDFYQEIYPKKEEINKDIGVELKWDQPDVDQKQISANYEIENVPFDNKEKMQEVNDKLIKILVKFRKCIEKYTN